jgi:UDP-GlcNAc:undecaprenyl-phosphate GlcNAc-1-phosphate transferase
MISPMNWIIVPFIAVIALVLHFLLVRYAHVFGLVDIPNNRSIHATITPRVAGVAIFISVALSHILFNWDYLTHYPYLHLAILFVFLVGLFDDKYNAAPKVKFMIIALAIILAYQDGIQITHLGHYFGYEAALPWVFIFPFTLFAISGLTNALNLIDGLDGLAGSIAMVILGTFLTLGWLHHDLFMITLSSSFMVALAVFLAFNWHPAKIFMGDSGSLTLGFVISILAIQSLHYLSPTAVLFVVAIPLLDTFVVMTRRIQRGKSVFSADKNHFHHFLYKIKRDVRFSVLLLVSLQLGFSLIGFQCQKEEDTFALISFITFFFVFLNLFDQRLRRRNAVYKSHHTREPS